MLIAKINPPATKTYEDAYNTKVIQAPYMCIGVQKMVVGAADASFELRYGILYFDKNNVPVEFKIVKRNEITLTSDESAQWGTDDSILFDIIVAKINKLSGANIVIEDKIKTDLHFTY